VGHGIDIVGDFVAISSEVKFLKQVFAVVAAAPAILGERIKVKSVVCCLCKFSIFDNLSSEPRRKRIQKIVPIGGTMDFTPLVRYHLLGRSCGSRMFLFTKRVPNGLVKLRPRRGFKMEVEEMRQRFGET
jgi:hypothetical protein